MFRSIAQNVGSNAIGVMLTGMGYDGAEAMAELRRQGPRLRGVGPDEVDVADGLVRSGVHD